VATKSSAQTGRFKFDVTATDAARKFRVVAPKSGRFGPITSAVRTVTSAAQSGSVSMPATVVRGSSFVTTFTFSPPRATRYVDVQELVGDNWETFDTFRMEADGTNNLRYGFDGAGTFTIRAVARAWKGAPAFATPPASVTTTAPPPEQMTKVLPTGTPNMNADASKVLIFRDPDGDGGGVYRLWDRASQTSTEVPGPPSIPGFVQNPPFGGMTPDLRYALLTVEQDLPDFTDSYQLYLWDRQLDTATLITHRLDGEASRGQVLSGSISDDGRFVVFASRANDLVTDDPTEIRDDVFLWDRTTGEVSLVSGPIADEFGPVIQRLSAISPNGSYVLYQSNIRDFDPSQDDVTVMVRWDRVTGTRALIEVDGYDFSENRELPFKPFSSDGRWVAVNLRENGGYVVAAVLDTTDNSLEEVPWVPSPAADGTMLPLRLTGISADGSTVTGDVCGFRYDQERQFLYEPCYVYVWERSEAAPVLMTKHWAPDDWVREQSGGGVLSADGRYSLFGSDSESLIEGDSGGGGTYLWDRDWTP
jgi:hypothetical protein